eukprot:Gb_04663 [translate_table: standard]
MVHAILHVVSQFWPEVPVKVVRNTKFLFIPVVLVKAVCHACVSLSSPVTLLKVLLYSLQEYKRHLPS